MSLHDPIRSCFYYNNNNNNSNNNNNNNNTNVNMNNTIHKKDFNSAYYTV